MLINYRELHAENRTKNVDVMLTDDELIALRDMGISSLFVQMAHNVLLRASENKDDFGEAVIEWELVNIVERDSNDGVCDLCGQSNLRYDCYILNKHNKVPMILGSDCIVSFNEVARFYGTALRDVYGNTLDDKYIKQELLRQSMEFTITLLRQDMYDNDFSRSIIENVKNKKGLTPKQLKPLKWIYRKQDENGQMKMRNSIKLRLTKQRFMDDAWKIYEQDSDTFDFLYDFMSPSQRKRFEDNDYLDL